MVAGIFRLVAKHGENVIPYAAEVTVADFIMTDGGRLEKVSRAYWQKFERKGSVRSNRLPFRNASARAAATMPCRSGARVGKNRFFLAACR